MNNRNREIMIGDKTLEQYLIENNYDLSGLDLKGVDFRGADLNGVNFTGCDMSFANFEGADFSNANLNKVNFERSILRRCNFYEANLVESNFDDAELDYAKMTNANVRNAKLTDVDMNCTNLYKVDMRGSDMSDAHIGDANLYRANLKDTDLSGSDIERGDLMRTNIKGARIANTKLAAEIDNDEKQREFNKMVIDVAVSEYARMNNENAQNYSEGKKAQIRKVMADGADHKFEKAKSKGFGIAKMIRLRLSKIKNTRIAARMAVDADRIEDAMTEVGEYDLGDLTIANNIMREAKQYDTITKNIYTDAKTGVLEERVRRREGIVDPDEITRRGEELKKQLEEQAENKDIDEVEKQLDCIEDEV